MANYVIYTREDKSELMLKLDSERTIELETRLDGSIQKRLNDVDKLSVACEFIAAAIPEGDHNERRKTALEIYDEMVADGKAYRDYLNLIDKILESAGFLPAGTVEKQTTLQEESEKLETLAYRIHMEEIRQKTEALEKKSSDVITATQS